jgi:polysaccharide export outer membrane protein
MRSDRPLHLKGGRFARTILIAAAAALILLTQTAAKSEDYRLGPGDLIRFVVFDHDELSVDTRVSQTGNITFPLVGVIPISGLTTRQAELLLSRRLTEGGFVKQPEVSVIVEEYQSQKVSVMGQVAKPGQYPLDAAKTVLDLLAMAGGVLNDTAADDATLVRGDGQHIDIDLQKLFDGDPAANYGVQGGETIFVPHAPQFYIYGQVQHPGQYRLMRFTTLSQAISIGGGLMPRGTEHGAVLKRMDSSGKIREYSVKKNDVLQPNDVLLIKASIF